MQCYAKHDISTARYTYILSVTLRYCGHIGWNTSKIILWLISLGCSLSADLNITDLLEEDHPEIPGGIGEVG